MAQGKLDVYGQLDANYVQQSAPHMKAIGAMVRRVIPTGGEHSSTTPTAAPTMAPTASATATLRVSNEMDPAQLHDAAATAAAAAASAFEGVVSTESVRMPTLNIDRANILTAGCSNTADFSTQVWYGLGSSRRREMRDLRWCIPFTCSRLSDWVTGWSLSGLY